MYRFYSVDKESGAVGGKKIYMGDRSTMKNLRQCHLIHHQSHMTSLGPNPGWKRATNRLSNGTTLCHRCEIFQSYECFLPYLSKALFTIYTTSNIIYSRLLELPLHKKTKKKKR
jgi:hypothetical protein